MKVKNTLSVDLVHSTLRSKLLNFIDGRVRYTGVYDAQRYVRQNFPSVQYNGKGQFKDVLVWCEEHFENDWLWEWETFYFKTEHNKSFFLLRWS